MTVSLQHFSTQSSALFEEFKAVSLRRAFPITIKNDEVILQSASASKLNPKAINLKLVELIKVTHGSFESK